MIKMMTQSLFIQFLLAFLECNSTCLLRQLAITYIDDQGAPMPSQFKFLQTNLNVPAGRNSVFLFQKVQSQALI